MKASASTVPIVGSLLPAMVATCVISFLSFSLTGVAMLRDRLRSRRRRPCGCRGPGPSDRRRRRSSAGLRGRSPRPARVAVVVPSPATSFGLAGGFLDQLGAQVLVGVVQLDLLGDGHAVLGDLGRAPALVEHGVAAAGAERAADGPGQLVTPAASGCRASSSKTICFAATIHFLRNRCAKNFVLCACRKAGLD